MWDVLHYFGFSIYPYGCLIVFLVGSAIRFYVDQYTWTCDSSQFLTAKKSMRVGILLLHGGILWILMGHVIGLLTPHFIYEPFIASNHKQWLAMITGGIAGVLCLIGVSVLLHRRLTHPYVRATSRLADILILAILWAQLVLGMWTIAVSMDHLDGTLMNQLANWAQHIATGRAGAATFLNGVPWVFRTHILLGLTIFLLFPFSKLAHIWSGFASLVYLVRPYQIVRRK